MRSKLLTLLNGLSGLVCLAMGVILTLEIGFEFSTSNPLLFALFHAIIVYYFFVDIGFRLLTRNRFKYFLTHPTDLILGLFAFNLLFPTLPYFEDPLIQQILFLIIMIGRIRHIKVIFNWLRFKPTQTLILGFIFSIFIGSLLLSLPLASSGEIGVSYIDALFIATSAICVTGLVTVDISSQFTVFGQSVILILIQIGGLGILSFSALVALFLSEKLSHKDSLELQQNYFTDNLKQTFSVIKNIFKFTIYIELLGAGLLWLFWFRQYDSLFDSIFSSIFHSVSAFCNAGFSLFPDSFVGYATQAPIILTISALIIVGGIGFPVIFNVMNHFSKKTFTHGLKLQTKIVLIVTGILLVFGTVIIYISEYNLALQSFSFWDKWLVAFFQSVSLRTAGFNSIPIASLMPSTLFICIGLMYIGASPGSTGGGIKTTTFGLAMTGFWHTMTSKTRIHLSGRTVSQENIQKALTIITLSAITITSFLFMMLQFDSFDFLPFLFETVSAFSTVGLSTGITPELSIINKGVIMVLMLIGRIGPLTFVFALSRQRSESNYAYPEENVLIT